MKQFSKFVIAFMSLGLLLIAPSAHAIKKCKDAEGKWHYGDTAEEACATSEVTTLTNRGFVKETLDAPKTAEELQIEAEREAKLQEELARQKAEQDERDRILSIYEREEDIDRQRDNQLASVDGNIRVHKAYLKQMDGKITRLEKMLLTAPHYNKEKIETELTASKSRVVEFSAELERLEEQKITISDKFANEKKLYRDLKDA